MISEEKAAEILQWYRARNLAFPTDSAAMRAAIYEADLVERSELEAEREARERAEQRASMNIDWEAEREFAASQVEDADSEERGDAPDVPSDEEFLAAYGDTPDPAESEDVGEWKLVPVFPTLDMVGAARECADCYGDIYQAMLAAAPTPPAAPKVPEDDQ